MAYPTIEQIKKASELIKEKGEASRISMEKTNDPYGLVRVIWGMGVYAKIIRPDGTIVEWDNTVGTSYLGRL